MHQVGSIYKGTNVISPRQVLQWRPIAMLVNIRKIVIHIQIHCSLVVLIRLVVVRSPYDARVQVRELHLGLTFKRRIKSRLPFAGIIRSSPYSTRFQDKG